MISKEKSFFHSASNHSWEKGFLKRWMLTLRYECLLEVTFCLQWANVWSIEGPFGRHISTTINFCMKKNSHLERNTPSILWKRYALHFHWTFDSIYFSSSLIKHFKRFKWIDGAKVNHQKWNSYSIEISNQSKSCMTNNTGKRWAGSGCSEDWSQFQMPTVVVRQFKIRCFD